MIMKPEFLADVRARLKDEPEQTFTEAGTTRQAIQDDENKMETLWMFYQKKIEDYDMEPDEAWSEILREVLYPKLDEDPKPRQPEVVNNTGFPLIADDPMTNAKADGFVQLEVNKASAAQRRIMEIRGSLNFFSLRIGEGNLMKSEVKTHLGLMRHAFNDLSELVDGGETLSKELEDSQALCRAANQRVRELEAELGKGITANAVAAGMRRIVSLFEAWYGLAGFRYAKIEVNQYGTLLCDFSAEIDPPEARDEREHTDQYREALRPKVPYLFKNDETQTFDVQDDAYHKYLLDTDNNRMLLTRIFQTWFPGCFIYGYESHSDRNNYHLGVKVRVPMKAIENLDKESVNFECEE